jgi:hypothetical protein
MRALCAQPAYYGRQVRAGDGTVDSGGVPWQGRELPTGPFAGDDGSADPALAQALDRLADEPRAEVDVVAAMADARLFVAVVAVTDQAAQMALLTVTLADGRQALPVFTSVAALTRWRPEARPVPVPGPRAALSGVAEGCDLLDLDPAGPVRYLVRRPAVWALGRGVAWTPSYADQELAEEIATVCGQEGVLSACEPGTGAELRVVLGPPDGLSAPELGELLQRVSRRLAASQRFADAVDSLELTVAPTRPRGRHA